MISYDDVVAVCKSVALQSSVLDLPVIGCLRVFISSISTSHSEQKMILSECVEWLFQNQSKYQFHISRAQVLQSQRDALFHGCCDS